MGFRWVVCCLRSNLNLNLNVLQTELSSITHFMAAVRPKLLQHERLYPAESLKY